MGRVTPNPASPVPEPARADRPPDHLVRYWHGGDVLTRTPLACPGETLRYGAGVRVDYVRVEDVVVLLARAAAETARLRQERDDALATVGITPGEDDDGSWDVAAEPGPVNCASLALALQKFGALGEAP